MEPILIGIIVLLIAALAIVVMRMNTQRNSASDGLQQALQAALQQQSAQLQQTSQLVIQQLNRAQESQERTSSTVHTRLDHATRVVSDVQSKLAQLEEANKRIFDLGKDISGLQRILQAPKLRGNMGEVWLKELISQILPSGSYKMQYAFKSGEACDAVILLRDGVILPVDSKFSLENFVKMMDAEEEQRPPIRRMFASDVKKRIDEIAKKYILPSEGTLEFAFMYVPAENVYYQAFVGDEDGMGLQEYAFSKRVIPVSPSSFYAYLQVILFGLRGMEIEQSAKEIQKNLAGLQGEFMRFKDTYSKVGTHLKNATASYDQTDKHLGKIDLKLQGATKAEEQIAATVADILPDVE